MIVNVLEAKAEWSKLVDMAFQGKDIIMAQNNLPLVNMTAEPSDQHEGLFNVFFSFCFCFRG